MGGIRRVRQTGRATAGTDASLIEKQEQSLGLDAVEGDVSGVGEAFDSVAVNLCLWDSGECAVFQGIAQRAESLIVGGLLFQRMSGSDAKADEIRHILRATPPGALLMTAMHE